MMRLPAVVRRPAVAPRALSRQLQLPVLRLDLLVPGNEGVELPVRLARVVELRLLKLVVVERLTLDHIEQLVAASGEKLAHQASPSKLITCGTR
jgi:hypothetical protein